MFKTQTVERKRKPSETLSSKPRGRRGSKRKAGVCAGVWFVCGKNYLRRKSVPVSNNY
ncbi:hypothetical protein J6590_071667, partial [Homalodisca vitripennis]